MRTHVGPEQDLGNLLLGRADTSFDSIQVSFSNLFRIQKYDLNFLDTLIGGAPRQPTV